MSENDISRTMASVWKAVVTNSADSRDEVIFELYRQREKYREALERVATYPYKGWTQQVAEKALDAMNQPPGKVTMLNRAIEVAVNRGLAATVLDGLPAGVEVMCKEGVPIEISKRVLLHPSSRRATDWRSSKETIPSVNPRLSLIHI